MHGIIWANFFVQQREVWHAHNLESCVIVFIVLYRCETFNSYIRAHNIFGNKSAPSHDIARRFSVVEQLRHICAEGQSKLMNCRHNTAYTVRCYSCGEGLKTLFATPAAQQLINSVPVHEINRWKAIYQPGTLRKVSTAFLRIHESIQALVRPLRIPKFSYLLWC